MCNLTSFVVINIIFKLNVTNNRKYFLMTVGNNIVIVKKWKVSEFFHGGSRWVEILYLHRTTEPCNLKSMDCSTKLNAKFLLIEIKPWLDTSFSLCHKLVVCDSISTSNTKMAGGKLYC